MLYDPNRFRAVMYGGLNNETGQTYADLWELDLNGTPAWRQLQPGGFPPPARYGHLALLDPVGDRMIAYSGVLASPAQLLDGFWRVQWFSDATAAKTSLISSEVWVDRVHLRWSVLGAAGATAVIERSSPGGAWTALSSVRLDGSGQVEYEDRAVSAGSRLGYRLLVDEGGEVTRSSETWVDVPKGESFALEGFRPNPSSAGARVAFRVAERGTVTLELIDLSGRRVAQRRIEATSPGAMTVEMAPESRLAPGLYFIRLTQGERSLLRRGTVVR
jgi:hypothetical protein